MTKTQDSLPEAPASATAKVRSPKGFSYLFTLRDTAGFDLLEKLEKFEEMVTARGWTPEENKPAYQNKATGGFSAKKEYKFSEDVCRHATQTEKTSKSEKNPGRKFFSCDDCGKWLNWVSLTQTQPHQIDGQQAGDYF